MATNWKKILEAGAIATDAFSKGSAGGLGKTLAESKIDLSGKFKNNPETDANEQPKQTSVSKQVRKLKSDGTI